MVPSEYVTVEGRIKASKPDMVVVVPRASVRLKLLLKCPMDRDPNLQISQSTDHLQSPHVGSPHLTTRSGTLGRRMYYCLAAVERFRAEITTSCHLIASKSMLGCPLYVSSKCFDVSQFMPTFIPPGSFGPSLNENILVEL